MAIKLIPYFTFLLVFLTGFRPVVHAQDRRSSILREGNWYKIAVTQDGIYKIDVPFLSEMGIDPGSVDPEKIKIYGNGGKLLPQPNSVERPKDLLQNSIWVNGEEDGRFDASDYILFYGQGPDTFLFDTASFAIDYVNHSYSDTTFYFMTIDGDPGKRVTDSEDLGTNNTIIETFIDYQVYEKDQTYLLKPGSGREWYQAIFSNNTTSFNQDFIFPGLIEEKPVHVKSHLLANSRETSKIDVLVNGDLAGQHEIGSVPGTTYSSKARESIRDDVLQSISPSGSDIVTVSLNFEGTGTGYLNYLLVTAYRDLVISDSTLFFTSWESLTNPESTYSLSGANGNTLIWDITDPFNARNQLTEISGNNLLFGAESNDLRHFAAFNPDQLKSPVFAGKVSNQDLQGTVNANLVIITHPMFEAEANRLADLRRLHDNLTVAVVDIYKIYNEFSSGSQDISAIRDFLKYLWDIDHSDSGLRHVLLFGKSSFDYKDRLSNNTNFVPTYESYNSLHPIFSYSSDDYFGFMEQDEGEWKESSSGDHTLDIGVGRIPVTTVEEARNVVDKYYTYALDSKTFGSWKNTISFVADDGDNNLHQRQAERLADTVERYDLVFNKKKIYLDAFKQEVIPGGETSKETYDFLKQTIDNGTFIVNFTGHGGERQWTDERILDFLMIEQWNNQYNLPIFITATCEFGRHDTPEIISGAEKALLREKGGAIALVTTARPVFASQNFELNSSFYQALLSLESGSPTLGDVFKATKNNSLSGSVNRNFVLLGDPSLPLAIPEYKVQIDSIASTSNSSLDTLHALAKITLFGTIRDPNSNVVSDFDGKVDVKLYEKPSKKETLGTKGEAFEYVERDNLIFKGKSAVKEGSFKTEFIMPRNILYQYGNGKFSFYASSKETMEDARGGSQDIVIGGSTIPEESDTAPPDIQIFLGDSTFVPGGIIKPNTTLVVKFFDQSGISISKSGLGQNIHTVLDDSTSYDLNDYYEAAIDTYQTGWVNFPLKDLPAGHHRITVKAWDVFNNPGESSIEFVVSKKGALVLNNLRNYPNPFATVTNFTFENNRAGEDLDVLIQIFNSSGEIVKESTHDIYGSQASTSGIYWDGTNSSGAKLKPGLYFYKIFVRSISDGATGQLFQKLIIY